MKKIRGDFRVKAFEKREIGNRYKKVYDKYFATEFEATHIAYEIMQRIGDIYGFSYATITNAEGEIIDSISGIYNTDISSDISML